MISQPIELLVNLNGTRAALQLEVGKEKISVSLIDSGNTIVEARPELDPVEEAMSIIQEESCSTYLERRCHSLHLGNRSGRYLKFNEEEKPQHPLLEPKPLPPRPK